MGKDTAWRNYVAEVVAKGTILTSSFGLTDLENAFKAGFEAGDKCACQPRAPDTSKFLWHKERNADLISECCKAPCKVADIGLVTCTACGRDL